MGRSMTQRGASHIGGGKAVVSPFMGNGIFERISITVDNTYNRGQIPAFSLWAPSAYAATTSWKYMPYIPPIPILAIAGSTIDIPNQWKDYFRASDEVIALDYNELVDSDNMKFFGQQGAANDTDITACTLGTHSATVSAVGAADSGGTGECRLTMTDTLDTDTVPAVGAIGTGDILVLAGYGTTAIKSYQQAQRIVIVEQEFDFADAITGNIGEGGYLLESAVYSYTGRIDTNYLGGGPYAWNLVNDADATPALTVCTKFTNGGRLNFENIYNG